MHDQDTEIRENQMFLVGNRGEKAFAGWTYGPNKNRVTGTKRATDKRPSVITKKKMRSKNKKKRTPGGTGWQRKRWNEQSRYRRTT